MRRSWSAYLEVDPAAYGCQSFEATDFLIRGRIFDPPPIGKARLDADMARQLGLAV